MSSAVDLSSMTTKEQVEFVLDPKNFKKKVRLVVQASFAEADDGLEVRLCQVEGRGAFASSALVKDVKDPTGCYYYFDTKTMRWRDQGELMEGH